MIFSKWKETESLTWRGFRPSGFPMAAGEFANTDLDLERHWRIFLPSFKNGEFSQNGVHIINTRSFQFPKPPFELIDAYASVVRQFSISETFYHFFFLSIKNCDKVRKKKGNGPIKKKPERSFTRRETFPPWHKSGNTNRGDNLFIWRLSMRLYQVLQIEKTKGGNLFAPRLN